MIFYRTVTPKHTGWTYRKIKSCTTVFVLVFVLVRYAQVFAFILDFAYTLISYLILPTTCWKRNEIVYDFCLCASVSRKTLNLVTIIPNSQQDEEGGWHT